MSESFFDKYGGFAVINKVVTAFYGKVLDSPVVAHYFENTDMKRQISHQTKFIAQVLGGPASYTNEELERVHSHYAIDKKAFDEIVMLLAETLEDFDFEDEDIEEVKKAFQSRSKFIINR